MSIENEEILISEDEILEFIARNDKRKNGKLCKYKDLIIRLLNEEIPKKEIYNFINSKDNSIGSQINFYKFISRNIPLSKKTKEKNTKPPLQVNQNKKEIMTPSATIKTPTEILSQDYDLLDFSESK